MDVSDPSSDLSLLHCAKACLSSDVIVAHRLLSRSLLAASLTSLCCGASVLLLFGTTPFFFSLAFHPSPLGLLQNSTTCTPVGYLHF